MSSGMSLRRWVKSVGVNTAGQASTKERRTFLVWLSTLVSTSTTDCQVPRVGRPSTTGMVTLGEMNAGST